MAKQGSYGIQIVVNGAVLPEIEKDGKTYLAAPSDCDYVIRVTTPSHSRSEVVLSVDGLSVMTGKDASSSERGYVITEGEGDIPGFRLNDSEVAGFRFGDRVDSYAAQIGKGSNVGVIAAKFFSEYQLPVRRMRSATRGGGGLLGGGTRGHDMGTEFGDRRDHHVERTGFTRDREVATVLIEYASAAQLRKAGIMPAEPPLGNVNAFPGDPKTGPGCTPPANWKGGKKPTTRRSRG